MFDFLIAYNRLLGAMLSTDIGAANAKLEATLHFHTLHVFDDEDTYTRTPDGDGFCYRHQSFDCPRV